MSPIMDEYTECFDPAAREVDYDKNPTDLFQALEAKQFVYADEMFKQVNYQFTRECKTWVVARGTIKDSSQLRFRALPLHAALGKDNLNSNTRTERVLGDTRVV